MYKISRYIARDYSVPVPGEGVEPSHPCRYRILSPARLPFRHLGQPLYFTKL